MMLSFVIGGMVGASVGVAFMCLLIATSNKNK